MEIDMFDRTLLDILVCPLSRTALRYDKNSDELISDEAGLAFPIRDGIPIMLVDEARKLDIFKACAKNKIEHKNLKN